jgi:hypothetical protein
MMKSGTFFFGATELVLRIKPGKSCSGLVARSALLLPFGCVVCTLRIFAAAERTDDFAAAPPERAIRRCIVHPSNSNAPDLPRFASLDLSQRRKKTKKINTCVSGFLKWKKGFVGGIQKFEFLFTTQKFNLQPGP